ncbi:major paralogous domain-containing protein [Fibrobacter sp. UWB15]|uniref:FISUMP domain-containing protein n=1 Tax=unclassified Fibrobacter TaxID=2634177 RepID=UPI000917D670|nr:MULTISPECIES: FISUMP domain-containing protein [unclassified Fibrobacter]PWJ66431.1 uncharacterized protein (TIGR02145 family) [Fibrobacter sp. UWB6]SHG03895.1 major paralogous domain-containing protein [Fibrobacter sp. UWB8]SMG21557.1 major paralogous domain-containing protein [Fibrobacter sp. UWB15]
MPMIFALLMTVLLSLTACGGDSGNSSNPAPEDDAYSSSEDNPSSSSSGNRQRYSSSYTITSATTVIDDEARDLRDDEPIYGEVTDTSSGNVYSTRSIGVYTWTNNINDKNASVKSTCYAYDDSYCASYGRLYMKKNADELCPSGFSFPTVSDWKYIMEAESKSIVYSGICFKGDSLECTGLKDSAQYFAAGDSAVVIDRFGHISATKTVDNGFYSLRCVKYRTIVEKMSDLPNCSNGTYDSRSTIYVATKDSSYYCGNGEWKYSSGLGSCRSEEAGEKYSIKDIVYICKNGYWQQTTIEDTDVKCTDENLYEEYVVNGIRYACTDTGMTKLKFPASVLGLCTPDRRGSLVELEEEIFLCKNKLWVIAMPDDLYGGCGTSNLGQLEIFKGKQLICSMTGWRSASATEMELGACTPSLRDSVRHDSLGNYFRCYKDGGWHVANSAEVLGRCKESEQGDSATYRDSLFVCMDGFWDYVDSLELVMGVCHESIYGARGEYAGNVYYCQVKIGSQWIRATEAEEKWGYCPRDTTYIKEIDGEFYKCDRGTWKEASQREVLGSCNSAKGEKKVFNGREYVCDTTALKSNGAWYAMTALDSALGEYCRTAILGKALKHNDAIYVCRVDSESKTKKTWTIGTFEDYRGKCDKDNLGRRVFNGVDTAVCIYNSCSTVRERTYAYNGKDTEICGKYNITGYFWETIVRESITDKRDGAVYGVLTFGTQKWLNRDLQYWTTSAYGSDGYKLRENPYVFEPDMYHSFYYVWSDALGGANICPDGTRIPSKADWKTLFEFAESLNPGEGVNSLLMEDWRVSRKGKDYFNLGLRRNGFMDMDYYPLGNDPLVGSADYKSLYYWTTDAGKTTSTGSAVYVDTLLNVNYQVEALKEDAYTIRCIVD